MKIRKGNENERLPKLRIPALEELSDEDFDDITGGEGEQAMGSWSGQTTCDGTGGCAAQG